MKKISLPLLLLSTHALASGGYDKHALWSARSIALGGAVASSVSQSEALLFNPAGISGKELSVHYAGYWGYLKSPLNSSNSTRTTDDPVFVPALVGSFQLTDKLALGFGYYGVAGLDIAYKDVNYGRVDSALQNYNKDYYANLAVAEYSLGVSYKLNELLRFGFALRGQSVKGAFQQSQIIRDSGSNAVLGVQTAKFSDLEDSKLGSYRAGIQFMDESKTWGLGATYRSVVKFDAEGKLSGEFAGGTASGSGGVITPSVGSDAIVSAQLPQKFDLDGHYHINANNTLFLGYTWIEYKLSSKLGIKGTLDGTPVADVNQYWHNMHEYKLGFENRSFEFAAYRFGYALTSQVTNAKYSSANSATPGNFHHFSFGLGKNITERLSFDGALEYYYSVGRGKSEASDNGTVAVNSVGGNSMSEVYGVVAGLKYQY